MEIVQGGVEAETRQALANMGAILEAVGASHLNVVKVTFCRHFNDGNIF